MRESEERFRTAFHTSPDSININRLEDGLFVDINEGFSEITGYKREDVIGKTSVEINIWNNIKDREKVVNALKEQGFVNNYEATFRMKDGRTVTGLLSARVIMLDNVPHTLSITRNIEDLKQAELALKESEKRYRTFFQDDLTGDYISTVDGDLLECN
ncbi:MAG: PAS domain S-box protein, partial [Chlorobi bacterium]|nr:PAS domain S-box protein [Chlorobiota bacterium]